MSYPEKRTLATLFHNGRSYMPSTASMPLQGSKFWTP